MLRVAVGRKAFLSVGSERAGHAAARARKEKALAEAAVLLV
jgi:hypothetical protein